MTQQCSGSQECPPCPGAIRHSISLAREGIVPLCSGIGWPHLKSWRVLGASVKEENKGLGLCPEGMRDQDDGRPPGQDRRSSRGHLASPAWEEKAEGVLLTCTFLQRNRRGGRADLLSQVTKNRTWRNGLTLCQMKFTLGFRKRFFTQRCLVTWTSSPGKLSWHQTYQGSSSIQMMLFVPWISNRQAWKEQGVRLDDSYESL